MLSLWDLGSYSSSSNLPKKIRDLNSEAPACYALAINNEDNNLVYACCSDGNVAIWDLRLKNSVPTRKFKAHRDGASCADFRGDCLWTGGLDNTVKCWDIKGGDRMVQSFEMDSQVFLGVSYGMIAQ